MFFGFFCCSVVACFPSYLFLFVFFVAVVACFPSYLFLFFGFWDLMLGFWDLKIQTLFYSLRKWKNIQFRCQFTSKFFILNHFWCSSLDWARAQTDQNFFFCLIKIWQKDDSPNWRASYYHVWQFEHHIILFFGNFSWMKIGTAAALISRKRTLKKC